MDSEEQSAKKGNTSSQVERDGEQDSTHHDVDGGSHPPHITQQQPLQKSFEKDAKVREKNLRLAQAVAPPPPPSITLTSSVNSDGAGTNNTRDSNKSSSGDHGTSKRKVAGANSLTSSINSAEDLRNSLQYSASRHAAKTAKAQTINNTRQIPAGPGAVRVSTGNPSEDDVDEEQGPVATLTAKAVDDGEEDRIIRQLQEDKEALQRQVQMALEGERKAREEMQNMARAPTANVAVVMGDAATSVVSEEPPPSESQPIAREGQRERCCINACKGTVLITACCCLSCIILAVVLVVTLGLDGIIRIANATDTTSDEVATKRSNLEELLQEFQPLHEDAFDWLVDTDQWQPNLDNKATAPPSNNNDQFLDFILDGVSNQGESSTIGTGETKWMFVERYYLAVLYFSTNGSNWKENYGWLSETNSHCDKGAKRWFGIECDENDSLFSITLQDNNLDGSFPTEIRALRNLRSIWMSGDGSDAKLTGTIPATMPANLTQIWLWNMRLGGTIPEQLFELSDLTSLRLYQNQLSGTIATSIVQLSDLKELELVGNQLTGTIPVLPNVTSCDLASNKFEETSNGAARGCDVIDQNP